MSILINGMKMPSDCSVCPLETDFGTCGYYSFYVEAGHDSDYTKRRDDCPLIEVPTPHGRLVDADVAYDTIAEADHAGNYVDMDAVGLALEEVPTIIEAEGEK